MNSFKMFLILRREFGKFLDNLMGFASNQFSLEKLFSWISFLESKKEIIIADPKSLQHYKKTTLLYTSSNSTCFRTCPCKYK